jgi:hypothetical protein
MHRKDHVSFSTNMTSEDESSGNDSCMQNTNALTSAVDCFHARKFGVKKGENVEKRAALKVVNPGKAKKQDSSKGIVTGRFGEHGTGVFG